MSGTILPYKGVHPTIGEGVYLADGAVVVGDVVIGDGSSVWFNSVVRGDVNEIRIGARSNIQDGSVVHVTDGGSGTYIADDVLIGHKCLLHACAIRSHALIGMGATIMDNVVVEESAMVAAGALVTPGKVVSTGQLWGGSPAKYMRDLSAEEIAHNKHLCHGYTLRCQEYLEMEGAG